ncbi:MAG: polysaccharide deacetylase family protein [Ruminococcus sp.]|nr:polysaccharide deacetylase family protein [Ruminococcus sp.]
MDFPHSSNKYLQRIFHHILIPVTKASLFLFTAFFVGHFTAMAQNHFAPVSSVISAASDWGLSFQEEGQPPVANATAKEMLKYNAYYVNPSEEKVLYLTFDAGYENGNTKPILEALKKHKAPATFFLVGSYISNNPDLVKQMVEEGHIVGNHTYSHPDMSQISSKSAFEKELSSVEDAYKELTGKEMLKFYRPPQGKYSEENLQMAKDLGYSTFFWSLAYVDWYENDQPTKEAAFKKLLGRIHPGAIVLLHSTSSTNAQILDELLTKWEEMGYSFRPLTDFTSDTK